jgi:hypothetical protein
MSTPIFRTFITDIRISVYAAKIYCHEIWEILNPPRPKTFRKMDYGSLEAEKKPRMDEDALGLKIESVAASVYAFLSIPQP